MKLKPSFTTWLLPATMSLMVLASLSGCANWPQQAEAPTAATSGMGTCDSGLTPAENTRLAGIEQLVNDGKFYAALAQLDALGATTAQARLVRADALRRIDKLPEAQTLYQSLLDTCLDGRSQHGLGLIAARSGRQAESMSHLQKARQALPTDTRIRNDLGYALLLAGQWDAARFEFLTVLDLSPKDAKAARNLVLLTFKQGQPDKAKELARKLGLDEETSARLQQQALQANIAPLVPAEAPPSGASRP